MKKIPQMYPRQPRGEHEESVMGFFAHAGIDYEVVSYLYDSYNEVLKYQINILFPKKSVPAQIILGIYPSIKRYDLAFRVPVEMFTDTDSRIDLDEILLNEVKHQVEKIIEKELLADFIVQEDLVKIVHENPPL